MRNLLEMIYEYQLLRSKEDKLDIELDASERVRLVGLHRLLQGEVPDTRLRRLARVAVPFPVQFTRPGGFETGEIRNLSGGGFCVATPRPPEAGTQIIMRVAEPSLGVEYVFPCRVVWCQRVGPGRMGVVIDGVPNRAEIFGDESTGVWRRSVSFAATIAGSERGEPLVA